ncbi:hypothetical protein RS130_13570 [Paraglaciecola aquimarina]|uniref:Uncharacterized protein n=1 Tax=Paraglaciecola aquimarina TaxID=1235557 RepID=A0ABU3SXR6_9ALTE|nr:hypothetical protein [Paraglaciecola aquimarina]MDU0354809.1 hypothetical protein [Paraglaciecola aquimarina]
MRSKVLWLWLVMLGSMLKVNYALAGEVEIVKAKFIQVKKGTWTIRLALP